MPFIDMPLEQLVTYNPPPVKNQMTLIHSGMRP